MPGITTLPDGRRISAERARVAPGAPVRRGTLEVDLDADRLPAKLTIRWPEPGDRFHALGAPGSKALKRFLADCGIPREERDRVPVVLADGEIIWVVGVRPAETCRVLPSTHNRLRLSLHETGKSTRTSAAAADAHGPEAQIGTR